MKMTVGGEAVTSSSTFGVIDPRTGEEFARAPECSESQLDDAFAAASTAFRAWRVDDDARKEALLAVADRLAASADELAALLVSESGKPPATAAGEVSICKAWLRYYATVDVPSRVLRDDAESKVELRRRPLGVVAAITPWNFPVASAVCKFAPALRMGNTVVLKPSPYTPLATLRLGEIVNEVLPPGVVNVVTGGDGLGAAMTRHPVPRKVTFTGSIRAGKDVALAALSDFKRLTLELGGNDAAILLDDADLSVAAPALARLAFFNAGQVCAAPKRIYVPRDRYDDAVEAFASTAASITAGPDGDMGPLSTRPQYDRVCDLVAEAIAGGATPVVGGGPVGAQGFYFQPTIFAGAKDGQRIVDEEQFGPALPILPYDDVDEAVRRANDTGYGLCGSVWSSDADRARAIAVQLECGVTSVNTHGGVHSPDTPFLGVKESGFGVENGVEGMLEFGHLQVVNIARIEPETPGELVGAGRSIEST